MLSKSSMQTRAHISPHRVLEFAHQLFDPMLHSKRIASIADATVGVLRGTSLAIHAIGAGLAMAKGLNAKHATKQVDRLLSNQALDPDQLAEVWVPFVLAARTELVCALDWTDFDEDDHTTLSLSVLTVHGRSTPLLFKTVKKSSLKKHRNLVEDALLRRLRELVAESVRITIVADRGFGDQKLYAFLRELNMDYIIRFRSNIRVTDKSGLCQPAQAFVPKNHRAKRLLGAGVTADEYPVGAVVLIHDRGMQQAWCLATSRTDLSARQIIGLYAKRFSCEETFRDTKNARLGLGLSGTHIQDSLRRDRLLMICALAMALLTLLGAAGESLGEDRMLKVNTVKTRTHSLFRQGLFYYQAMDTWPIERSARLLARFSLLLSEHAWCRKAFGLV
jgi:hypothetical protein